MEQQPEQNLRKKVWYTFRLIAVIALLWCLEIVIFKFFGLCASVLACAIICSSMIVRSLLSREYRDKVGTFTILGYIFLIIILWVAVYAFCVECI